MERSVATEAAMAGLGGQLAAGCGKGGLIYLCGELGAGKTTFARGLLQGLGYRGLVKSPTYTLVESYMLDNVSAYHFDLYRISNEEELEYAGLRDYFSLGHLCLVEWPERGAGVLPQADVRIDIAYSDPGRRVSLRPLTSLGEQMCSDLEQEQL
jgi:tRNA threonylcarbamoyladenosine biosynthesis protein TsaE